MPKGTILLSAGGTGGHLFPAEALAHEDEIEVERVAADEATARRVADSAALLEALPVRSLI